jgi:hypothetical protein
MFLHCEVRISAEAIIRGISVSWISGRDELHSRLCSGLRTILLVASASFFNRPPRSPTRDSPSTCKSRPGEFTEGHQFDAKLIKRIPKDLAGKWYRVPDGIVQAILHFDESGRGLHVALEDSYVRRNWDEIDELCKLNGIPFEPTGEHIHKDGHWCVYQFADRVHAVMFWDRFEGRWFHQDEFRLSGEAGQHSCDEGARSAKSWTRTYGVDTRG